MIVTVTNDCIMVNVYCNTVLHVWELALKKNLKYSSKQKIYLIVIKILVLKFLDN